MQRVLSKKSLGILLHPSSIPGGRVCGTFGRGAKEWIKTLNKHGIEYWQFLPLTPTDSTGSPYSSPSSFALNPWFLDIDYLIDKGFIFISNIEELGKTNQSKNNFDFDLACSDSNGDGNIDILDIIQIVDLIFGGRLNDASSAKVRIGNDDLLLSSDGYIGGIQMTLSHGSDFKIDLTSNALVAKYKTKDYRY